MSIRHPPTECPPPVAYGPTWPSTLAPVWVRPRCSGRSPIICATRLAVRPRPCGPSTTTGRSLAVRDRMQDRRVASTQTSLDLGRKVTCYLSAEFLMGPQLGNNLLNLRMEHAARTALAGMGQDLDEVLACEVEPGLGNGGLGRLAACYLDSLATLERPAIGYGIRYE